MLAAAIAMGSIYMVGNKKEEKTKIARMESTEKEPEALDLAEADTEQPAESVTKVITPKQKEEPQKASIEGEEIKQETVETEEEVQPAEEAQEQEAMSHQTAAAPQLDFKEGDSLNWPLQGDVILNYSMDQTVYFATLDQYKYNPAVIIRGEVNDRVSCAASGKVTDISNNEVTGCTVTMDLGNGYQAIYGQLKEVPHQVGDYVEGGSMIGFISEPTKYYSVEGSNLYFALTKDGNPVDPVSFFE